MDNIVGLFTGTEGRINRQKWWLGVVIIAVIYIVLGFLILPIIGISMMPNMGAMVGADGNIDATAFAEVARRGAWASLIIFLVFAYPYYALSMKRRHDKDNNGMDVFIYLALSAVVLLIQALGIGIEMQTLQLGGQSVTFPGQAMWLNILTFALGIYSIYLLVVLGFLRGTAGPNQYGPDPLGGAAPATA